MTTTLPHRWRSWSRRVAAFLLLLAALGATGWHWHALRSAPLEEAIEADQERENLTALRRAMDYLERDPKSPDASIIAARSLSRLDLVDQAEPYYERARLAGRLSLDDQHTRAYWLTRAARVELAATAYQEILDAHPDDAKALQNLADIRLSQTRFKDALKLAVRLAEIPGKEVPGQGLVGAIEHEQRHPDRAVLAFERVLRRDPQLQSFPAPFVSLFWTYLAEDLISTGRPQEARRHLTKALARSRDPVKMTLLGLAYQMEGQLAEAERCFRQAADWDPTLFQAWLSLGRLMLQPQLNRPEEAVTYLKTAAQLRPTSFEAPYSLSLAYGRLHNKEEADRYRKLSERLRRQQGPESPAPGMGTMPGEAP